jgi:plasmid stability protein
MMPDIVPTPRPREGAAEKTTLYLADDMRHALRDTARRSGRPQAEMVREALTGYLTANARPRPRSLGAGSDKDLSAVDSEDWLRARWRGE